MRPLSLLTTGCTVIVSSSDHEIKEVTCVVSVVGDLAHADGSILVDGIFDSSGVIHVEKTIYLHQIAVAPEHIMQLDQNVECQQLFDIDHQTITVCNEVKQWITRGIQKSVITQQEAAKIIRTLSNCTVESKSYEFNPSDLFHIFPHTW
ncbi:hypothetical protein HK100_009691, partial [Physocladia obscura]